ncbi:MAG TPA: hypothetical protein VGA67_01815, partial [Candidatus Dojkabacteria bacterium]
MLKKLLIGLGIFFGLILTIILQYILVNQFSNKSVSEEKNLITSNPIDLSQISRISKFRSCAGHNFSGYNVQGVRESNRSMKH